MLLDGYQLGRYRLIEEIGSGGMGTIFLAEITGETDQVAVKLVRTDDEIQTKQEVEQRQQRFQREMGIITRLHHPSILPVLDSGRTVIKNASYAYLVMPYCPDGSLADWHHQQRNNAPLALPEVAHILSQAAEALHYAHEQGIVHQDVKPSNFLLRAGSHALPELFLTDFGIARFFLSTATQSRSQDVRGTPMFMAPEQWDGKAVPASDQYALAIMAYRLLTGQFPFVGAPGQIMHQHYMAQPSAPSSLNAQLDASLDEVILRALAKQPQDRFPDITAFARAFAALQQQPSGPFDDDLMLTVTATSTPASALQDQDASMSTASGVPIVGAAKTVAETEATPSGLVGGAQAIPSPMDAQASSASIPATQPVAFSSPSEPFMPGGMASQAAASGPGGVSSFQTLQLAGAAKASLPNISLPPIVPLDKPSALPRHFLMWQKLLLVGLLACIVLAGGGFFLFSALSAPTRNSPVARTKGQTDPSSLPWDQPAGAASATVIGNPTPHPGQTPASGHGSTSTSNAQPATGPTSTPRRDPPTSSQSAPKPTPAPSPTPTPGCTIAYWKLTMRDTSTGTTVFYVTNYCNRTVYMEFAVTPAYNADVQICFGASDCTSWYQYASYGTGVWFVMSSALSPGAGFTINGRCHGGVSCPAEFSLQGYVKY